MGRVRGKGKKQTVIAARDELESVEEGKNPTYRKRGRPQKSVKDYPENDGGADKFDGNGGGVKGSITAKEEAANGNDRKRTSLTKESVDSIKEENGDESKSSIIEAVKPIGFRQNGNRRKSTPRRAAEVGVECN